MQPPAHISFRRFMHAIICLPPVRTDDLMVLASVTLRATDDAACVHALVARLTTHHEAAPAKRWAVTGARWRSRRVAPAAAA